VDPARQGRDRHDADGRGGSTLTAVELHHERQGSGPAVLLLHGLGGTGTATWKHLAPELARDFTVVVPDLRGAGASPKPPGPYSLQVFVDDLRGLVERLELAPVAIVGHSFGGSIVLEYAAQRGEAVSAVIAVGAPTELPEQNREGMRARAERVEGEGMAAVAETVATNATSPSFREARPDEFQAYVELLESADPAGYAATCRTIADLDIGEHLARITAPVLLVGGELDGVAPPELNRRNGERLAEGSYVELSGCGHVIPWEKPEALLDAARSFLLEAARLSV
jgi:3-oxoadipate enol-lactonase